MKKILSIIIVFVLAILSLVACNEAKKVISEGETDASKTVSSLPEESASEDSMPDQKSKVIGIPSEDSPFTQEQIDEWINEFHELDKGLASFDGEHTPSYFLWDKHFWESDKMKETYMNFYAKETKFGCVGGLLEYADLTWDEYIAFYCSDEQYEKYMTPGEDNGRIGYAAQYYLFDKEAWTSEEYWKHENYISNSYVAPKTEDYYTSIPKSERNGYMKMYYVIDWQLREYVGEENFQKWLDEKEDKDQNILDFIEHFKITQEIYEDIYSEYYDTSAGVGCWRGLPYLQSGLFGTPEMQDEYFKVHPLD